jgi:hypothetical protein
MGATLVLTSYYNIRNRTDGKGSNTVHIWVHEKLIQDRKSFFALFKNKSPCFLLEKGNSETFARTGR